MKKLAMAPIHLLVRPEYFKLSASLLLLLEVGVVLAIIRLVPYTEIDWVAYMQEVEGFLNGSLDYTQLKGDTGPLVYPAGFVYIYSAFYYLTRQGADIWRAQYIFATLYVVNLGVVLSLYTKLARTLRYPPYLAIFLCCTAYRVHSIFLLRLFNDPIATLLLYVAVYLFLEHQWNLGCIVYSLAVSIKMNILLYSPGLLTVLLLTHGWAGTIPRLALCAITQVVLGAPFLLTNPGGYLSRSFNMGRRFLFKWTVNWKFLPEEVFLHRAFHVGLLAATLLVLAAFALKHWTRRGGGMSALMQWRRPRNVPSLTSGEVVWILFTSNFIGVYFSRSLHYQFYVWYFHTLPALLWSTRLHPLARVGLLLVIEYCWNVYPATVTSSLLLLLAHTTILVALWRTDQFSPPPPPTAKTHVQ